MIGDFHAVLNFNQLFLKLNQFICNRLAVLPNHRYIPPTPKKSNTADLQRYALGLLCGHFS